jgi:hypothetical protein
MKFHAVAVIASLLFSAPLSAATIILDDFNVSQGPVVDVSGGGATTSTSFSPSPGDLWTSRTISVLASGPGLFAGDPTAVSGGGIFGINNDSLETSTVSISWTLDSISFLPAGSTGSLALEILNNNPNTTSPTTFNFAFSTFTLGPITLPAVPPGASLLSVNLNALQFAALTGGTTATLTFNGGSGYDLVLQRVSLNDPSTVPEPAPIATLLGGIFGFAVVRRRRAASMSGGH